MIVRYLDLETGRKAEENGISEFALTEGNWSCDCNRKVPFGETYHTSRCNGCRRFVVYDVESEASDATFDPTDVIREANSEYYQRITGGNPRRIARQKTGE